MIKLFYMILFSIMLLLTTGCNKEESAQRESTRSVFGITKEDIKQIEIMHDNIIIYDGLNEKELPTINKIEKYFESSKGEYIVLNEYNDTTITEIQSEIMKDTFNYIGYIEFITPQNIIFQEISYLCESLLIHINDSAIYVEQDNNNIILLGYQESEATNNTRLIKMKEEIESIFEDFIE